MNLKNHSGPKGALVLFRVDGFGLDPSFDLGDGGPRFWPLDPVFPSFKK